MTKRRPACNTRLQLLFWPAFIMKRLPVPIRCQPYKLPPQLKQHHDRLCLTRASLLLAGVVFSLGNQGGSLPGAAEQGPAAPRRDARGLRQQHGARPGQPEGQVGVRAGEVG